MARVGQGDRIGARARATEQVGLNFSTSLTIDFFFVCLGTRDDLHVSLVLLMNELKHTERAVV